MNHPLTMSILTGLLSCGCVSASQGGDPDADTALPHTDPGNQGDWVLNTSVSDEFEADELDTEKWHIQGTDGFYRSNFYGRAPSEFSLDNVRVEDGKLKIQTRWEPDYPFREELGYDDTKFENITTAAVISKAQFQYGYMEIKAKAANASISSAFWMTGNKSELDIFEHMGRPAQQHKKHLETEIWSSVHDWSKPRGETKAWTDRLQLPFKVAEDFNVYACEWHPDGLKFYVNGEQIRDVSRDDVKPWVLTGPMWVWMDSEAFPWHGLPTEDELPADYEIEYVRIWQRSAGGE